METGLYIHVPYCRLKCIYCDFYSGGARIADWKEFSEAIAAELSQRSGELAEAPSTIYFGGGTPSLIPGRFFARIVEAIDKWCGTGKLLEFTVEVNPEDVTEENCKIWKENGVNRISMGIQTMDDRELKSIGRRHDRFTIFKAYESLQRQFSNISVDLMFGLPGQSLKSYEHSLNKIIGLHPCHISSYSLMLEEGTAMTLLVNSGKIKIPDEEVWTDMFNLTSHMLRNAGYKRYEVSNFALPGYESRHNTAYWKGDPYLGIGPSAHSYDGHNTRRMNPPDIKAYLNHFSKGKQPKSFFREEILTQEELREEMIMTRLRMAEGLNLQDFRMRFGDEALYDLLNKAGKLNKNGLLETTSDSIRITEKGIPLGNDIMASLF